MAETNKLIVFWKLIIPVAIALILIFYRPHFSNLTQSGFMPYGLTGIFAAISNGGIALSYFGFQTAIFLAGEAENPQKAISFALFGSLIATIVLYTALQIGFILSVDSNSLTNGWHSISFKGDAGPFAGIFIALGLMFMVGVLYFDAIISPFGTAIGYVASSSRILFSMSLQGDAPASLAKINKFAIPWLAIVVNFFIGMLFFLPFSGWQEMASFLSGAIVITLACGPICLPIFRKDFSDLNRPFKLKYATFVSVLSFYLCNLLLFWTGWNTVWKLEIAVISGIVIQFLLHFFRHKNLDFHVKTLSWVWIPAYLFIFGVISYLGAFGGGRGIIPTGVDFVVILIASLVVFFMAQKFRIPEHESKKLYKKILENHTSTSATIVEV